MKYLFIIALVATLTMCSEDRTQKADNEIEYSHKLHDSAMKLLDEMHHHNDSLINVYFPL